MRGWSINASESDVAGIYVQNTRAHFIIEAVSVSDGKANYKNGIELSNVTNARISNCHVKENYMGIYLNACHNCVISNDHLELNFHTGMTVFNAHNNTIVSNEVRLNTRGIEVGESNCTVINDNTVSSSKSRSIGLQKCNSSIVRNNSLSGGVWGLFCESVTGTAITGNVAFGNNLEGMYFIYCSNNSISSNILVRNKGYGLRFFASAPNTVCNNYFDNTENAGDTRSNRWNTTYQLGSNIVGGNYIGGNYWADYRGRDKDGDGIGDMPYVIDENNRDMLPLILFRKPSNLPEDPYSGFLLTLGLVIALILVLAISLILFTVRKRRRLQQAKESESPPTPDKSKP